VSIGERLTGAWEHRRDLGGLWWRFLGFFGLSRERFHGWKPWQRRAGKVALAGVFGVPLALVAKIAEHPRHVGRLDPDLDVSAYVVFS
jgi:hypothetical protein